MIVFIETIVFYMQYLMHKSLVSNAKTKDVFIL